MSNYLVIASLSVLFSLLSSIVQSQSISIRPDFFTLKKNNQTLLFPLLGGLNSPRVQFGDINGDAKTDMLILSQGEFFTFIRINATTFSFVSSNNPGNHINNWFVLGDLNNDGYADLLTDDGFNRVQLIYNNKKPNHWFEGDVLPQSTVSNQPVITESLSQPTLFDADNNGTLDLFSGLSTGTIVHFRNTGSHFTPQWTFDTDRFGSITVLLDTVLTKSVSKENLHGASAVQLYDLNKDGFADIFFGDFFSRGIYYFENKANPDTVQFNYITPSFPNSTDLQTAGFNQVNFSDYDLSSNDLFVTVNFPTSDKNNFYHFKNIGTANQPAFQVESDNFISMPDIGSRSHVFRMDINSDGKNDILLTGESGKISAYTATSMSDFSWLTDSWGNLTSQNNLSPAMTDLNGDGRTDIIHGMFDGKLRCYIQQSNGTFSEQNSFILTDQPNNDFGSYSVPSLNDWDNDGDFDLAIGNSSGAVFIMQNNGTKNLPVWNKLSEIKQVGQYASPFFYDWNHDGHSDLVIGNDDGYLLIYFHSSEESLTKFSEEPDLVFQTNIRGLSPAEITETDFSFFVLGGCNRGGLVMLDISKSKTVTDNHRLIIYPNPVTEQVTVQTLSELGEILIFNLLGQLILRTEIYQSDLKINTRFMSSGIYFIQFRSERKIIQNRFTVIH